MQGEGSGLMLPLDGIRVVALEQAVAGPLCTRHLADLGADVVKIERPGGGDLARRYDTVVQGQATYFVWLNRGKRSIALDLAAAGDREVCVALLARADVFVHNQGPGAVDRLGFGSRLISCAISGYELRVRARETLEPLLEEAFLPLPRSVAEERLADGDVPFAARSTVADLVAHPQLSSRGRWAGVDTPGGRVRALVPPFNIGGAPARMGAVPGLDQHGAQIRDELSG